MSKWPQYPTLYEINTWVWLSELSKRNGTQIDLGSVPAREWNQIAEYGFDAVWLMGVWERSPVGIATANRNENLLADFRRTLPDFSPEDNVGSPYCVRQYVVDRRLGGPRGLAEARRQLADRGMLLILDFVPNHVAPDHPWVAQNPEYFLQGTIEELQNNPTSLLRANEKVYACGKDPYFPAWPDVLQLNAFHHGLRGAVVETLSDLAEQCDGVRCDMAMLLLNAVFARTWGDRAGTIPGTEYWSHVIPAIKRAHPGFRFIAEAYWDLEWELQQKGFDYCYDKKLYDRLEHDTAESVRLHLCADLAYQQRLLRFLENHDEPRAAFAFPARKEQAAAVATYTLPGARLFHDGQFEGRKVRLPVFLGRRPEEPINEELPQFYQRLLSALNNPTFRDGEWNLCDRSGWPDNATSQNIVAWRWNHNSERVLIVVNLSDVSSHALVHVGWRDLGNETWELVDRISGTTYPRSGAELMTSGLYVDLGPWGFHFLDCRSVMVP